MKKNLHRLRPLPCSHNASSAGGCPGAAAHRGPRQTHGAEGMARAPSPTAHGESTVTRGLLITIGNTSPSPTPCTLLAEGSPQARSRRMENLGLAPRSTQQPRSAIRALHRDAGNVFNIFMDYRPGKAQLMTVFTRGLSQSPVLRTAPSPSACGRLLPRRGFAQGKPKRDLTPGTSPRRPCPSQTPVRKLLQQNYFKESLSLSQGKKAHFQAALFPVHCPVTCTLPSSAAPGENRNGHET